MRTALFWVITQQVVVIPYRGFFLKLKPSLLVKIIIFFLISNFRRVLNNVFVLLGISPASDCNLPTFRYPLSGPSSKAVKYFTVLHAGEIPKRTNTLIIFLLYCYRYVIKSHVHLFSDCPSCDLTSLLLPCFILERYRFQTSARRLALCYCVSEVKP
jgi:hypothetical protein